MLGRCQQRAGHQEARQQRLGLIMGPTGAPCTRIPPTRGPLKPGRLARLPPARFKEDAREAETSKGTFKTPWKDTQIPHGPEGSTAGSHRGSCVAMILGGGPGDYDKLFPLTEKRALPAIPVAGVYRLIDIPISNLINSGINKMYIITQFQSQSLNRYLSRTYNLSGGVPVGGDGFVEVLSASQTPSMSRWSEGTADAVRQFTWILSDIRARRDIVDVLVLPSDHLYRTDFAAAVAAHRSSFADITILCQPCEETDAENLGLVQVDCTASSAAGGESPACVITAFQEKPRAGGKELRSMRVTPEVLKRFTKRQKAAGGGSMEGERPYMASTGIYIFRREVLVKLLEEHKEFNDFGKEVMPYAVASGLKVMGVPMDGPWQDVGGSVREFYEANIAIAHAPWIGGTASTGDEHTAEMRAQASRAPFFDPIVHGSKLFQAPTALPPTQFNGTVHSSASFISPGCIIGDGTKVVGSIVGARSLIGDGCDIKDAVIMGADYYESEKDLDVPSGHPPIGLGDGCVVRKAIIDKNARIGKNVQLINAEGAYNSANYAATGVYIRDGVIVVAKSAVVPDGSVI